MLRSLQASDVEAIRTINQVSLGYSFSAEDTARQLEKLGQDAHHYLLGFEDKESQQLVGYVHAEVYESLYSYAGFNVLGLAVLPDSQGRGIGQSLMKALEKEAQKRGYGFIRLNSASHRTEAHAFYERIGYDGDKLQKRFIKHL